MPTGGGAALLSRRSRVRARAGEPAPATTGTSPRLDVAKDHAVAAGRFRLIEREVGGAKELSLGRAVIRENRDADGNGQAHGLRTGGDRRVLDGPAKYFGRRQQARFSHPRQDHDEFLAPGAADDVRVP